jgi:hypothetical protein
MLDVNTYGQKRKNILSYCPDGQYSIIFEGYITVRHQDEHALEIREPRIPRDAFPEFVFAISKLFELCWA